MKKLRFLLVLGIGFLLGSRAGSGPYEQVAAKVRSLVSRPDVHDALGKAKGVAQDMVDAVAHGGGRVSDDEGSSDRAESETSDTSGSGAGQAKSIDPGAHGTILMRPSSQSG